MGVLLRLLRTFWCSSGWLGVAVVAGGEVGAEETFGFCRTGVPARYRRSGWLREVDLVTANTAGCSTMMQQLRWLRNRRNLTGGEVP